MAKDTAGFTWPPGREDKAQSKRGVQCVCVCVCVGGWHDILSIISEAVTFTRGNSRGAAPQGGSRFVFLEAE